MITSNVEDEYQDMDARASSPAPSKRAEQVDGKGGRKRGRAQQGGDAPRPRGEQILRNARSMRKRLQVGACLVKREGHRRAAAGEAPTKPAPYQEGLADTTARVLLPLSLCRDAEAKLPS